MRQEDGMFRLFGTVKEKRQCHSLTSPTPDILLDKAYYLVRN